MNEALSVFLHFDEEKPEENEKLIQQIDELLLTAGMKYSGFQNMYIPVKEDDRDSAVFRAGKLLEHTEWLKDTLAWTSIATLTNACPLDAVLTDRMSEPEQEKLQYYEAYYLSSHNLPHAIVVDEGKQLRDGYISYLLARKYGVCPDIYQTFSSQPLRKLVIGKHVEFSGGKWKIKNDKRYCWIYTQRQPVIPGDILQVNTKRGLDFICVDRVDYVTGREFCRTYKKVKRHINMRLK